MTFSNRLDLPLGTIIYQSRQQESEEYLLLRYINDILQECASRDPFTPSCELVTQGFRIFDLLHDTGERQTIFFTVNFDVFSASPKIGLNSHCQLNISDDGALTLSFNKKNITTTKYALRNMATVFQYAFINI